MPKALENVDSKYKFIVLASDRSRQLIEGYRPKIESTSRKFTIIAMEEVLAGAIDFYNVDDREDLHGEEDGKE